jgi:hypothetical protein
MVERNLLASIESVLEEFSQSKVKLGPMDSNNYPKVTSFVM